MAGQAASSRRSPRAPLTYTEGQATVEVDVQGCPDVAHPNPDGRSSSTFTAAGLPSLDVSLAESARSGFPIKRALPSAGRTHAEDVYSGDRWPPANFPTQKVGDVHPLGCERFLLPTDTPGVCSNPSRPEFGSPEPPSASILACIEANLRTPRRSALPAGGPSVEHHLASG